MVQYCLTILYRGQAVAAVGEGLVLFGSVARGEANAGSDVDLLIVMEAAQPLHRGLYRVRDEIPTAPMPWREHVVNPQFVRLPSSGQSPSGLWLEVAIDGKILYDRLGATAKVLNRLRAEIASGAVVRRQTHGHPYWLRRREHAKSFAG